MQLHELRSHYESCLQSIVILNVGVPYTVTQIEDQLWKLSTKHHTCTYAADDTDDVMFANLCGWTNAFGGGDEAETDDVTDDAVDDAAAMFALLSGWMCAFCADDDTDDGGGDGCCCLTYVLLILQ